MIIYCESNQVLNKSLKKGLINNNDVIRSTSPYILNNKNFKTEDAQSTDIGLTSNISKSCIKLAKLLEENFDDKILCSFAAFKIRPGEGFFRSETPSCESQQV